MSEAYDGREVVGMDLHRRRSVLVRMTPDGRKLETTRITNSPAELRRAIARAGRHPRVVLEATYGWYWAADTLAAAGAKVHLAHPLGVRGFRYRRVKNDEKDAADLADLHQAGPAAHQLQRPGPHRAGQARHPGHLHRHLRGVAAPGWMAWRCRSPMRAR